MQGRCSSECPVTAFYQSISYETRSEFVCERHCDVKNTLKGPLPVEWSTLSNLKTLCVKFNLLVTVFAKQYAAMHPCPYTVNSVSNAYNISVFCDMLCVLWPALVRVVFRR